MGHHAKLLGTVLWALLCGCQPDALPSAGERQAGEGAAALVEEPTSSGLFFLPPIVKQATVEGTFDPTLAPVVRIERLSARETSLGVVATISTISGAEGERLRVDRSAPAYVANWHTGRFNVLPGVYRINVLLGERTLGFADVELVSGPEKDCLGHSRLPSHHHVGSTLPIRFWLNTCAPVVCTAADACHLAGSCNLATATCSSPYAPEGAACDDGNRCTQTDVCSSGACVGAEPVLCVAADACHAAGACDPGTGVCSNPPVADGTACDDHDACTQLDGCVAGACVGASPVVCPTAASCHLAGACDPATGTCSDPTAPDGAPCEDGSACTTGDTCSAGVCHSGANACCLPGFAGHYEGVATIQVGWGEVYRLVPPYDKVCIWHSSTHTSQAILDVQISPTIALSISLPGEVSVPYEIGLNFSRPPGWYFADAATLYDQWPCAGVVFEDVPHATLTIDSVSGAANLTVVCNTAHPDACLFPENSETIYTMALPRVCPP